jgi:hypothetical protein
MRTLRDVSWMLLTLLGAPLAVEGQAAARWQVGLQSGAGTVPPVFSPGLTGGSDRPKTYWKEGAIVLGGATAIGFGVFFAQHSGDTVEGITSGLILGAIGGAMGGLIGWFFHKPEEPTTTGAHESARCLPAADCSRAALRSMTWSGSPVNPPGSSLHPE